MKTIIFTVTNDLSYDQRMIRICNSLAVNGFKVLLVGRKKRQSIPLTNKKFQQHRLNVWFSKGKFFYLEYNFRLFFYLLFHRFDIIGSVDLDTLLPCYLASKLKKKPCVFDAHEYFTEVPEVVNRPITKKIWGTLGNWIIPNLKYAYTVSASLQEIFTKKYGIPFGLIRNVSSTKSEKASSKSTNNQAILLYQGVLNEGRGLEAMIATMSQIENAQFWLAGEGDLSDNLRLLVTQSKLTKRVKFLGYLTPEKLEQITAKATVGINLIENKGLSYYYSLANKTFDYMHAGVPAINMDYPEYQRINTEIETAILVKDLEIPTLVTAINRLLKNEVFYQKLKDNCEIGKNIFNWEKEEVELIKLYEKL